MRRILASAARLALVLAALQCRLAAAQTPAEFYKGKTISLITSTGVGGAYDVVARLVARYMPRYIPGNPTIIVQNMPGGGNVLATNYMFNLAPKDGTAIATIHSAMPLQQVLDAGGVRYDADQFNWLGSTGAQNEVVLVWHTAGIKTLQEATERPIILGGTGAGAGIVILPTVMNNLLGTKFKIVTGYRSSEDVNLGLRRSAGARLRLRLDYQPASRLDYGAQGQLPYPIRRSARQTLARRSAGDGVRQER
jgi:tripartite-type tricarboxylate transporter receptor subunit TctC